ncbi:MAG TPA: hypothetical protein VFT68_08320 [Lapillicoccus sp.]|nr:hypothetical protein [Lapillicoccus sp.]
MKKPPRRRAARAVILASLVTVGIVGGVAAAATASDGTAGTTEFTKVVFRETIGPWKSVNLPPASCGDDAWLVKAPLAPGRIVPNGVEITEPGGFGIGVNISFPQTRFWGEGLNVMAGNHGYTSPATATNWSPFLDQELTVTLHCTTDRSKADTWGVLLPVNP